MLLNWRMSITLDLSNPSRKILKGDDHLPENGIDGIALHQQTGFYWKSWIDGKFNWTLRNVKYFDNYIILIFGSLYLGISNFKYL